LIPVEPEYCCPEDLPVLASCHTRNKRYGNVADYKIMENLSYPKQATKGVERPVKPI
jgi:hypothetical protein